MTKNKLRNESCLLSMHEPRSMKDALENEDWIQAMKEEIGHIENNKTWTLVPRLENKNVIGTKWYTKNKLDENGNVTRNKKDWFEKDMHKKKEFSMELLGIRLNCKIERSKNSACLLCIQRIQSLSNRCEVIISEWDTRRGGLH